MYGSLVNLLFRAFGESLGRYLGTILRSERCFMVSWIRVEKGILSASHLEAKMVSKRVSRGGAFSHGNRSKISPGRRFSKSGFASIWNPKMTQHGPHTIPITHVSHSLCVCFVVCSHSLFSLFVFLLYPSPGISHKSFVVSHWPQVTSLVYYSEAYLDIRGLAWRTARSD